MFGCLQPPPIEPLDNQLSLADLEVIKVIGKGGSGNVQLVKHKLTQQFFALKVVLFLFIYVLLLFRVFSFLWLNKRCMISFSGHSIEHRRINMSGDFSGAENKLELTMSISSLMLSVFLP